ncbi:MAG: hypothetical protein BWK79_20145 [Beggiatoa sp. IS2]|nr:MAG: hypothetical protein BWK79_20145 [Beggiatoa sp. IS2]
MTIKYSVQPSNLAPSGITEPYGRYQVEYQSDVPLELNITTAQVSSALNEGNTVVLLASDGEVIGRIVPSVKGGFVIAEATSPTKEQAGIGFVPLEEFRYALTFAVQPTVQVVPIITSVQFFSSITGITKTDWVSTTEPGLLTIIGSNLGCL